MSKHAVFSIPMLPSLNPSAAANVVITLHYKQYLLCPTKLSLPLNILLDQSLAIHGYAPVTAIPWDNPTFSDLELDHVCQTYGAADDVWCSDFLSAVLLLRSSEHNCVASNNHVFHIDNLAAQLPAGPLMVECRSRQVFKVARLMQDEHAAFVSSTAPFLDSDSNFVEFSRTERPLVPYPSRLYYPPDAQKPLNGLRIAVKDTIALQGLPTSYGSKAWLNTYGSEKSTASCIRRLIDAGAIIVGKTKSSEFAEGTDPCDWTDSICPYNPRGDGLQKPSSSSTGSGAAAAACCWLDASIGTDTGGSIRHVAAVTGLYGQRPTTGICKLDGVYGATDLFNTVGVMARSVEIFRKIGLVLNGSKLPLQRQLKMRRYELLYPTRAQPDSTSDHHRRGPQKWFPHPSSHPNVRKEAEKDFEKVVQGIEKVLDCQRVPFNLNELWTKSSVVGSSTSLDDAVGHIYADITTCGALDSGMDQFIQDYASKHNGSYPPMAKIVRDRLAHGRTVTPEQTESCLKAMQIFKDWLANTLFSTDPDVIPIMLIPQSFGIPNYRDVLPDRSELFNNTFSVYAFGYLGGCPDYTIPVSDIPYKSKISGKTEYLPSSLSLIGRPGSDLELFDVVEDLHRNGIISDVMTGSRMFPPRD